MYFQRAPLGTRSIGRTSAGLTAMWIGLDQAVAPRLSMAFAVKVYSPDGTFSQIQRNESVSPLNATTPRLRSPAKNSTARIHAPDAWAVAVISIRAGATNEAPPVGRTIATVGGECGAVSSSAMEAVAWLCSPTA